MVPEVLRKIQEDFNNSKENFNVRKWYRSLSDKETIEYLNKNFPQGKSISEKLYMFLHNITEKPKDKIFKNSEFKYVDKDTSEKILVAKPVTETLEDEVKELTSLLDKTISNEESPEEFLSSLIQSDDIGILLTFDEQEFINSLESGSTIYTARTSHSSGQIFFVMYNPQENLVFSCLVPNNVQLHKFKRMFEEKFNVTVELSKFPLFLYKDVFDLTIQNSPALAPMAFVLKNKHILCGGN